MNCEQTEIKDICISFLYLESLEKRGLLQDVPVEMKHSMIENALSTLYDLKRTREKIYKHREKLDGFPAVNLISKDYAVHLDFNIPLSSPQQKGESVFSQYDIKSKMIKNFKDKEEGVSINTENILNNNIVPSYDRENEIISFKNDIGILSMVFQKGFEIVDGTDRAYPDYLLPKKIKEKLVEYELDENKLHEVIYDAHNTLLVTLSHSLEDEEGSLNLSSEKYAPLRINQKAIIANSFEKEKLLNHYKNSLVSEIEKEAKKEALPLSREDLLMIFEEESNIDLLSMAINQTQNESDMLFSEIPKLVAEGSIVDTKKAIVNFMNYNKNSKEQLISSVKSDALYEMDCKMLNEDANQRVKLFPVANNKMLIEREAELFVMQPHQDDPALFKEYRIAPKDFTLSVKLGTKGMNSSELHVKNIFENDEVKVSLNKKRNTSKAKKYKVNANYIQDFYDRVLDKKESVQHKVTITVDEADYHSAGEMSNAVADVIRNFGGKVNIATGTPINGKPESAVNILKFTGMPLEAVEKNRVEFQKLYGVNSIKSQLITMIIQGLESHAKEFSPFLNKLYSEIKIKEKNRGVNAKTLYTEATKDIISKLVSFEILDQESGLNMNINQESISINQLFKAIETFYKKNKTLNFDDTVKKAVMTHQDLSKTIPKISSLQGFAGSFVTIAGKESISSTDAGVRKELIFKGANNNILNFQKDSDERMGYETFIQNNRSGVRIAQAILGQYNRMRFTSDIFDLLNANYKFFYEKIMSHNAQGKRIRNIMLGVLQQKGIEGANDLTANKLFTLMGKSTTSSKDDLSDFYKKYLRTNGDLTAIQKNNQTQRDTLKQEVFKYTLELFDNFLKQLPSLNIASENIEKKGGGQNNKLVVNIVDKDGVEYNFSNMNFKFTESFMKGDLSYPVEELLLDSIQYGYPVNTVFSVNIDICPSDLMEYINPDENGKRIPYRYELINPDENQIFDIIGSLGIKNEFKNQILEGANSVNFSQRIVTNGISTLNYISALSDVMEEYRNNSLSPEQRKIVEIRSKDNARIIINRTSDGGDRFNLKKVFESIREQDGVEILPTKRNILDTTLKRSAVYDNKSIALFSHYGSIARGFTAGFLHTKFAIHHEDGTKEKRFARSTLNFSDPVGGGDGIQALSRLESPDNDINIVDLFNGGNDGRLKFFGEKAIEVTSGIIPSVLDFNTPCQSLEDELSLVINSFIRMDKSEADALTKNIVIELFEDENQAFGITQTSLNARTAMIATNTYNKVMNGEAEVLHKDDMEKLYLEKEVIDLAKVEMIEDNYKEEEVVKEQEQQEQAQEQAQTSTQKNKPKM